MQLDPPAAANDQQAPVAASPRQSPPRGSPRRRRGRPAPVSPLIPQVPGSPHQSPPRGSPRRRRAPDAPGSPHQAPPAQAADVRPARPQQTQRQLMQGMFDTMQDIRASLRQNQILDEVFEAYLRADAADRGLNLGN